MKQFTTQQGLDREGLLTSLQELDILYHAGNFAAYEQTWQEVCQQVERAFPGFTLAYAEIYNARSEREPLSSVCHCIAPAERSKTR